MSRPIIVAIDGSGRLVVPKEIREQANLEPNTPLRIRYADGRIEIEPEPRAVDIRRRGWLAVAVPVEAGARLEGKTVDAVVREVRVQRKGR